MNYEDGIFTKRSGEVHGILHDVDVQLLQAEAAGCGVLVEGEREAVGDIGGQVAAGGPHQRDGLRHVAARPGPHLRSVLGQVKQGVVHTVVWKYA